MMSTNKRSFVAVEIELSQVSRVVTKTYNDFGNKPLRFLDNN